MLGSSILVVDEDDNRRRGIASSLAARGVRYLDVGDAFAGMAALGRADFGCVLALEGRRTLSLRGLCQLARKRHPDIEIFVVPKEGSDEATVRSVLDMRFEVIALPQNTERLVTQLIDKIEQAKEPTNVSAASPGASSSASSESRSDGGFGAYNPFEMPSTEDAAGVFDSIPRVEIPHLSQTLTLKDASTLPMISTPAPLPSVPLSSAQLPVPLPIDKLEPTEPTEVGKPVPLPLITVEMPPPPTTTPDMIELPEVTTSEVSQPATVEMPPLIVDGHFEDLEGGAGAAFLMGLFSQELTGRLLAQDGAAAGSLYLYRGEPVWADDPQGDAGLYRKLVQKSFLKPDHQVSPVPEGQLLGSLIQAGSLTGAQMHDFMREVVRDRVIAVAQQQHGAYRFNEDKSFLDTAPLLKVNPFGLIMESRRRTLSPPALMALQGEIEDRFAVPGPGLASADEKLTPFLRGARATEAIDGHKTVKDVLSSIGLDPFMGTLVMVTMRDTRLVALEEHARPATLDLSEHAFTGEVSGEMTMVDVEIDAPPTSAEEAQASEDIYALYMRLKPLTQPRQVLGVGVAADEAAIEAAYRARMEELDPRRIPEGSAQQLLAQRIEELRRKVTSAYQTLKLQLSV